MRIWAHFKTITRHRWAVRRLCFKVGLYWQGLTHDLSKYSPQEFLPGCRYYQGFRSPNDLLFRDDLARWESLVDLILTVDGAPEGYEGNVGLVTKYIPGLPLRDPSTAQAIVVGPPPMMRFSVKGLLELGLAEESIWVSQERKMCCGLGKCGHCRIGEKYVCLDGPVFNYTQSKQLLD